MRLWPFSKLARKAIDGYALKSASFLYSIGAAHWLERRFDLLAREGYERNPIVYACVTKLAKAFASVDLHLYQQSRGKLKKIEEHALLDLLAHPNPTQGGRKFFEAVATYYLVGGNSYVLAVGAERGRGSTKPPRELWLLPNQQVDVDSNSRTMLPRWYDYNNAQGGRERFEVDQITGWSPVLHLKTVNLLNPLVGLPPMAAAYGVDVFNAGQEWNKALLDHDARPAGALEVVDGEGKPASLTPEQRTMLREELDTSFAGKKNAGRPLVLEGGMKWTPMSLSPKDMDHRENMLTNARFIAGVYHTPPQLVNIPGESTFSNYGQAQLSYWGDTVLPLLGTLLEDINNWLVPLFGEDLFLWYDEDEIPALEPRRKEKADRINAATYLTLDEKRHTMGRESYKPSKEPGNIILVPVGSVPLEMAGQLDEEPEEEEPAEDPHAEEDGKKSAYTRLGKAVRRKPIPFDRPATRKARKSLKQSVARVLREAAPKVAEQVRFHLGTELKSINDEIDRQNARRIAELLRLDALDVLADVAAEELEAILADTGKLALAQLGVANRTELVNQVSERAATAARQRAAEMVGKRWIDGALVNSPNARWRIDEATRDEVRHIIAQGLIDNVGSDAIAEAIENATAFSEARAELIADTEIARANSEGSLEAYHVARDAGVSVRKSWLADAEACPVCEANENAGPIDLDDTFPNGDDAPPAHPRCECAILPVTDD